MTRDYVLKIRNKMFTRGIRMSDAASVDSWAKVDETALNEEDFGTGWDILERQSFSLLRYRERVLIIPALNGKLRRNFLPSKISLQSLVGVKNVS